MSGKYGCSMYTFKIKSKKLSKKQKEAKKKQRMRFEREAELYEMIQLPNGDFKKVLKNKKAS